jgi:hypothetical protein
MSASDYLEQAILSHIFGEGEYTVPTIYVGLSTADPGEDGSGLAEPDGVGSLYERIALGTVTVSVSSVASNDAAVEFPEAGTAWGHITHFALFDTEAVGAGELLMSGELTVHKDVAAGDAVKFSIGALIITLN